jgi:hypothetical protein
VTQQLLLELSGNFDFLLKEDIRVQIVGLLTDLETGDPVSGATVTITIFDPDGNELLFTTMTEEVPGSGIYIYRDPQTLKDLDLPKGIYMVQGKAIGADGEEAYDVIQFHIDPPGGIEFPFIGVLPLVVLGTVCVGIAGLSSLLMVWYRRKNKSPP